MNRVTIEPTQFTNVRSGEVSYGFRAYDDEGQTYGNLMESIPDDDLEFLELVVREHVDDVLGPMLDYVWEDSGTIDIGDTRYEFEQFEHILKNRYE